MTMQTYERELHLASTGCHYAENGMLVEYETYAIPFAGPLPSRQFCLDLYDETDPLKETPSWWRKFFQVRRMRDGTLQNGDVSALRPEVIEDPILRAQVEKMRQEDHETLAARAEAVKLAAESWNNDPNAVVALRCRMAFAPRGFTDSTEKDGITFFWVGRNSSHQFYMGLRKNDDGTVDAFSGWLDCTDRDAEFGYEPRESFAGGYYGHH